MLWGWLAKTKAKKRLVCCCCCLVATKTGETVFDEIQALVSVQERYQVSARYVGVGTVSESLRMVQRHAFKAPSLSRSRGFETVGGLYRQTLDDPTNRLRPQLDQGYAVSGGFPIQGFGVVCRGAPSQELLEKQKDTLFGAPTLLRNEAGWFRQAL